MIEVVTSLQRRRRGALAEKLRPGGRLYSDALSGPDGPDGTYVDMFRHNVELIATAMAPAQ